jgi:hypothetical protein
MGSKQFEGASWGGDDRPECLRHYERVEIPELDRVEYRPIWGLGSQVTPELPPGTPRRHGRAVRGLVAILGMLGLGSFVAAQVFGAVPAAIHQAELPEFKAVCEHLSLTLWVVTSLAVLGLHAMRHGGLGATAPKCAAMALVGLGALVAALWTNSPCLRDLAIIWLIALHTLDFLAHGWERLRDGGK